MLQYLKPLAGLVSLCAIVIIVNIFAFDQPWRKWDSIERIIIAGSASAASLIIVWILISPLFDKLARNAAKSGDVIGLFIRYAITIATTALVFRLVIPKSYEWFAGLGEFFNPPLTTISLVALAVALKVSSDQVREQELSRKLGGSAWIVIEDIRASAEESVLSLLCLGSGPALNLSVTLTENAKPADLNDHSIGWIKLAALTPDKSGQQIIKRSDSSIPGLPATLWAHVTWQSSQLLQFSYSTQMSKGQSDRWLPASTVLPVEGGFYRELQR